MKNLEEDINSFFKKNKLLFGKTTCKEIIFRDEYIAKCAANHCGQYNKKWSCPPAIEEIDFYKKRILSYENILLFSWIGKLEDNYDVEGMDEARHIIMKLTYILKRKLDSKKYDYMLLGAGSCEICKDCTYPNEPCRHPELMLIPMEAFGIDVYDLSKKCNTKYYNGTNTVTYFCAIIY
ncbi:MAG: DUF2284 domain-containing protein [Tenericutes bacterium]|nr:DUF2284 domain-containing protein [Mycoplasmatota bacterium]